MKGKKKKWVMMCEWWVTNLSWIMNDDDDGNEDPKNINFKLGKIREKC